MYLIKFVIKVIQELNYHEFVMELIDSETKMYKDHINPCHFQTRNIFIHLKNFIPCSQNKSNFF